jgi:5'(3')-deoxyribonucleotidase
MNRKFNTIFIDLDGVLCDFHKAFCDIYGYDEKDILGWGMHTYFGVTPETIRHQIDYLDTEFWATLPKLSWADKLVDLAKHYKLKIYFASSPAKGSHCGKMQWMEQHYPEYAHRLILIKNKYLLAKENTCLIDDAEYQSFEFMMKGGYSVTFPRPWNYNRKIESDKLDFVNNYLKHHSEPYEK